MEREKEEGLDKLAELLQRAESNLDKVEAILNSDVVAKSHELQDRVRVLVWMRNENRARLLEKKHSLFLDLFEIAKSLRGKVDTREHRYHQELNLVAEGISVIFIRKICRGGLVSRTLTIECEPSQSLEEFIAKPHNDQFWTIIRGFLGIIEASMKEAARDVEDAERLQQCLQKLKGVASEVGQ